jgi:hypothetical protein
VATLPSQLSTHTGVDIVQDHSDGRSFALPTADIAM